MAEDRAVRRRLGKLRDRRVEALRAQARTQAMLDIIAEQGSVSVDEINTRVEATFVEPTDEQLRNLLAQKTRAGVDYEARELRKLREARERAESKIAKYEALLADARGAVTRIDEQIAAAEGDLESARALAAMADPEGDADAAPRGDDVAVDAEVATAPVTARGTDDDVTETPPESDVAGDDEGDVTGDDEGDATGDEG
jgi:hypothetical protein